VPALHRRQPVLKDGLIAATKPLVVRPEHIAGWNWFLDPDPAKRDVVPVLRPREP
jgi:hypothetical protein